MKLSALDPRFEPGREARLERTLRAQAKWGSRDRRMFAEGVYDSVRWWRLYWNLAGLPDAEHFNRETLTEARVWLVTQFPLVSNFAP